MSILAGLLGDTLVGSCWRAYEAAEKTPNTEARIFVRSLPEAFVALDILIALADAKGMLVRHDNGKATALAEETGSFVALELVNGSVIALKPEGRSGTTERAA